LIVKLIKGSTNIPVVWRFGYSDVNILNTEFHTTPLSICFIVSKPYYILLIRYHLYTIENKSTIHT